MARIILTRECAAGAHDRCTPRVEGTPRGGGYREVWECGCSCSHGAAGQPASLSEAYKRGLLTAADWNPKGRK